MEIHFGWHKPKTAICRILLIKLCQAFYNIVISILVRVEESSPSIEAEKNRL